MSLVTDEEILRAHEAGVNQVPQKEEEGKGGIWEGVNVGAEGFGNTMQAVGQGFEESHLDKLQSVENPEDQKYIDAYTEETKSKSRYALKKEFAAQEAKAANLSTSGQFASGAVELGANLAPMALALNPVTAPLAVPIMSGLAGAQAYGRIAQDDIKQDRDIDQSKAVASAATDLVWNAAVGKYIPKGIGTATALKRIGGEALGSSVGELGSEGIYNLATGRDFTENMVQAGIGGLLIGGGIKGAGEAGSRLKDVDWANYKPMKEISKKFSRSPVTATDEVKAKVYDAMANEKEYELTLLEIQDMDISSDDKQMLATRAAKDFNKQIDTNKAKSAFEAIALLQKHGFKGTDAMFDATLLDGTRIGEIFGVSEKRSDRAKKVIKDASQGLFSAGGTTTHKHIGDVKESAEKSTKDLRAAITKAKETVDEKLDLEKQMKGNDFSASLVEDLESLSNSLHKLQGKATSIITHKGFDKADSVGLNTLIENIAAKLASTDMVKDVRGEDGGIFNAKGIVDTLHVVDSIARQEHPSYTESVNDPHAGRSKASAPLADLILMANGIPIPVVTMGKEGMNLHSRKKLSNQEDKTAKNIDSISSELAGIKSKLNKDKSNSAIEKKRLASEEISGIQKRLGEDVKKLQDKLDAENLKQEGLRKDKENKEGDDRNNRLRQIDSEIEAIDSAYKAVEESQEALDFAYGDPSELSSEAKADYDQSKKEIDNFKMNLDRAKEGMLKEKGDLETQNSEAADKEEADKKERQETSEGMATPKPEPVVEAEVAKQPKKEKKVTKKAPDTANEDVRSDPDVKKAFDAVDKKGSKVVDAEMKIDDKQQAYDDKEKEIRDKHDSDTRKAEADYEKALASGNEKDIEDTKFAVEDLEQIRVDGLVQNYTVKERHELDMAKEAGSRADQEYDEAYEAYEEAQFEAKAVQDAKNRDDYAKRKAEDDEHNKGIDEEDAEVVKSAPLPPKKPKEPETKKEEPVEEVVEEPVEVELLPTNEPAKPETKKDLENKPATNKSIDLIPKKNQTDINRKAEDMSSSLFNDFSDSWSKEQLHNEIIDSYSTLMKQDGLDHNKLNQSHIKKHLNQKIADRAEIASPKVAKTVNDILKPKKMTPQENYDELIREGLALGYTKDEITGALLERGVTQGTATMGNRVKVLETANKQRNEKRNKIETEGNKIVKNDEHGIQMVHDTNPDATESQIEEAIKQSKVIPGAKLTDKNVATIIQKLDSIVRRDANAAESKAEARRKELKSDNIRIDKEIKADDKRADGIAERRLAKKEREQDAKDLREINDNKKKLAGLKSDNLREEAALDSDINKSKSAINAINQRITSLDTQIAKAEAEVAKNKQFAGIHSGDATKKHEYEAIAKKYQTMQDFYEGQLLTLKNAKVDAENLHGALAAKKSGEEFIAAEQVEEIVKLGELDQILASLEDVELDAPVKEVLALRIQEDNADVPVKERLSKSVEQATQIANDYKSLRNRKIFDKGVKAAQAAQEATKDANMEDLIATISGLHDKVNEAISAGNQEGRHVAEQAIEGAMDGGGDSRYPRMLEVYHKTLKDALVRKAKYPNNPEIWLGADGVTKMQNIVSSKVGSTNAGNWYKQLRLEVFGNDGINTLHSDKEISDVIIPAIENGTYGANKNYQEYVSPGSRPSGWKTQPNYNPEADGIVVNQPQGNTFGKDTVKPKQPKREEVIIPENQSPAETRKDKLDAEYKELGVSETESPITKKRLMDKGNSSKSRSHKQTRQEMIDNKNWGELKAYDALNAVDKAAYDKSQKLQAQTKVDKAAAAEEAAANTAASDMMEQVDAKARADKQKKQDAIDAESQAKADAKAKLPESPSKSPVANAFYEENGVRLTNEQASALEKGTKGGKNSPYIKSGQAMQKKSFIKQSKPIGDLIMDGNWKAVKAYRKLDVEDRVIYDRKSKAPTGPLHSSSVEKGSLTNRVLGTNGVAKGYKVGDKMPDGGKITKLNPFGDPELTNDGVKRTRKQRGSETYTKGNQTKRDNAQEAMDADARNNAEFLKGKISRESARHESLRDQSMTGAYTPEALRFFMKNDPERFKEITSNKDFVPVRINPGAEESYGDLFSFMDTDSKKRRIKQKDMKMNNSFKESGVGKKVSRFYEDEVRFINEHMPEIYGDAGVPHQKRSFMDPAIGNDRDSHINDFNNLIERDGVSSEDAAEMMNDRIGLQFNRTGLPKGIKKPVFEIDGAGDFRYTPLGRPKYARPERGNYPDAQAQQALRDADEKGKREAKIADARKQYEEDPSFTKMIDDQIDEGIKSVFKVKSDDSAGRFKDHLEDNKERKLDGDDPLPFKYTAEETFARGVMGKKLGNLDHENGYDKSRLPGRDKMVDTQLAAYVKKQMDQERNDHLKERDVSGLARAIDEYEGGSGNISDNEKTNTTIELIKSASNSLPVKTVLGNVIPKLDIPEILKMVSSRLSKRVPADLQSNNVDIINGDEKILGMVRSNDDYVKDMRIKSGISNDMYVRVYLHEAVHAAVSSILRKYEYGTGIKNYSDPSIARPTLSRRERALYNELNRQFFNFKTHVKGTADEGSYAATNIHEFAAEGLTNKRIQEILKSMPSTRDKTAFHSAYTDFVKSISKFFGFRDENALMDLMNITDHLMVEQQVHTQTNTVPGMKGKLQGSGELISPSSRKGVLYEEYANLKPGDENMEELAKAIKVRGMLSGK